MLDHREQGGYERHAVDVHVADAGPIAGALVYVATEHNPNWLGPAPLSDIAQQIRGSTGPSGPNPEYVLQLAEALRALHADDEHVFALAALLAR